MKEKTFADVAEHLRLIDVELEAIPDFIIDGWSDEDEGVRATQLMRAMACLREVQMQVNGISTLFASLAMLEAGKLEVWETATAAAPEGRAAS